MAVKIIAVKKYLVFNIALSSVEMSTGTKRDGAIAGNLFVSRKFLKQMNVADMGGC